MREMEGINQGVSLRKYKTTGDTLEVGPLEINPKNNRLKV